MMATHRIQTIYLVWFRTEEDTFSDRQVIIKQILTSQQRLVSNSDRTIVISLTGPQAWYLIK
jgi:hypothetical protein